MYVNLSITIYIGLRVNTHMTRMMRIDIRILRSRRLAEDQRTEGVLCSSCVSSELGAHPRFRPLRR